MSPKLILEFLGAAAGVAALMALAGGALLWLRFDELGLPADRIVTLLPRELLITVGAHALIAAAVAGLVAVVVIYALDDRSELVRIRLTPPDALSELRPILRGESHACAAGRTRQEACKARGATSDRGGPLGTKERTGYALASLCSPSRPLLPAGPSC